MFRQDLFHRLNIVTIHLPPLRERREDIAKLIDYFLGRFARELQISKPPISDEAIKLLHTHAWPGNIRELQHCIHRTMIFTRGYPIQEDDVRRALGELSGSKGPQTAATFQVGLVELVQQYLRSHTGPGALEQFLETADKLLVLEALRQTKGNQTQAAKLLGLPRPTLHAKIQKHGVRPENSQ